MLEQLEGFSVTFSDERWRSYGYGRRSCSGRRTALTRGGYARLADAAHEGVIEWRAVQPAEARREATTRDEQRGERFNQMIRRIVELFDDSRRDAGAVLEIDRQQWKVCGALGVRGRSAKWCRTFPAELLDREANSMIITALYD